MQSSFERSGYNRTGDGSVAAGRNSPLFLRGSVDGFGKSDAKEMPRLVRAAHIICVILNPDLGSGRM